MFPNHILAILAATIVLGMCARRRRLRKERLLRRYRNKRLWIHPLLRCRQTHGHFQQLYSELKRFPSKFEAFCRLNVEKFEALLTLCEGDLTKEDTIMRCPISPEERLLVTLRFLATGESYTSMHLQFLLGKSTISYVVVHTCQVIWKKLQPIAMPVPQIDDWNQIANDFLQLTSFPNCIGAIDGKHVRVNQPSNSGTQYFNYKKFFSMVLMAICDAKSNFIFIETGSFGSTNDARILEASAMGKHLFVDHLSLPLPQALPDSNIRMPAVFLADEAFALSPHLLRPFCKRGLTPQKRVFNTRLSRARKVVECAFGILSNQWRVLRTAINLKPENIDVVIKTCCALHNYMRKSISQENQGSTHQSQGYVCTRQDCVCRAVSGWRVRDHFCHYFNSETGAVAWQFQ